MKTKSRLSISYKISYYIKRLFINNKVETIRPAKLKQSRRANGQFARKIMIKNFNGTREYIYL